MCFDWSFEDIELLTGFVKGSVMLPFGFGWEWLVDVWKATELCEAQFRGGEAFTAVAVALLRGVNRLVALAAG